MFPGLKTNCIFNNCVIPYAYCVLILCAQNKLSINSRNQNPAYGPRMKPSSSYPHRQIIGLRLHYFRSKWNLFDLLILLVTVVDIVVELGLPESTTYFSPAALAHCQGDAHTEGRQGPQTHEGVCLGLLYEPALNKSPP